MILSHKYHFIFVRTTKVAGTSIEIALSKYCGPKDVLTDIASQDEEIRKSLGYPGPQNYFKSASRYSTRDIVNRFLNGHRPKAFYGHMPARDIRAEVGERMWNSYFKFSIVRNPFDYAVSRYYWSYRNMSPSPQGFREYLMSKDPKRLLKNRDITHINGKNAMNFMVRYENFEADLGELSSRIGLPDDLYSELKNIRAEAGFRPKCATTADLFSDFPEGVQLIAELFHDDIQAFCYGLPGHYA